MREHPAKEYRINPKGEISMSDTISQIIAPYRQDAPDYDAFHKLVTLACAAWNACLISTDKHQAMIQDMPAQMPDQQAREDFLVIFDELMKRKKKLFPHVSRMIVNFKVTDLGNDFHLAVASTLEGMPSHPIGRVEPLPNAPKKPDNPLLAQLEKLYAKVRPQITPVYPYNPTTGITLPEDIVADLKYLLAMGNKPAAVKRVSELTGAGLRVSKDYVDRLQ